MLDMSGEMEGALTARFEATSEYINTRKLIGVNDDKITEVDGQPCPLGKQNAFKKAKVEEFEEVGALDRVGEVAETLNFDTPSTASAEPEPAQSKFLPPADVSDTTNDVPVETAPTDNLTSFVSEGGASALEIMTEAPTEAEKIELDLPKQDGDVIATAPTGVDEGLFESVGTSTLESAPETAKEKESVNETPAEPDSVLEPEAKEETKSQGEITQVTAISPELVKKILDSYAADVAAYAKKKSDEAYNELSSALGHSEEPAKEATGSLEELPSQAEQIEAPSFESSLMRDAMSQIEQIKTL